MKYCVDDFQLSFDRMTWKNSNLLNANIWMYIKINFSTSQFKSHQLQYFEFSGVKHRVLLETCRLGNQRLSDTCFSCQARVSEFKLASSEIFWYLDQYGIISKIYLNFFMSFCQMTTENHLRNISYVFFLLNN